MPVSYAVPFPMRPGPDVSAPETLPGLLLSNWAAGSKGDCGQRQPGTGEPVEAGNERDAPVTV